MTIEPSLYPELTEQGKCEAQKIMDSFKPKILAIVKELIDDLYTDVSYYVESDHWTNYRNALLDGFRDYKGNKTDNSYDYKQLRQAIYDNNREQIIKDLNQDLLEEIESLKKQVQAAQQAAGEYR